jgi:hypothetical protein
MTLPRDICNYGHNRKGIKGGCPQCSKEYYSRNKKKALKEVTAKVTSSKVVSRKGCGHIGKTSSTHDNLCTECWLSTKLCPICGYSLYLSDSLVSPTKTTCRVCPYNNTLSLDMAGIQAVIRRRLNTKQLSLFKDSYSSIVYKIYLGILHWVSEEHIAKILGITKQEVRDTVHSLADYPGCKPLEENRD